MAVARVIARTQAGMIADLLRIEQVAGNKASIQQVTTTQSNDRSSRKRPDGPKTCADI